MGFDGILEGLRKISPETLIIGTDGVDALNGRNVGETIIEGAGDDTVFAGAGDDIITRGKGNDTLVGGYGADTYLFNLGDGQDIINNYDSANCRSDRILFGEGISPEDIPIISRR